jgi:hypothetical protein
LAIASSLSGSGGSTASPLMTSRLPGTPPGEHAGEPLRLQAQDAAGERDHAVFDRELDEAARLRRRAAHRLDLVPGVLPDLIELQCRLLGERVAHQISDRGFAELLGRSDPDPIDDPCNRRHRGPLCAARAA